MNEVVEAVRAAAQGKRPIDTTRLAGAIETAAHTREEVRQRHELLGLLSDRERQVLVFLRRGMRNSEIAHELSISPRTVEKHVHHILTKLEVGSRLPQSLSQRRWVEIPPMRVAEPRRSKGALAPMP